MENIKCEYCFKKLRIIKEDGFYDDWERKYHKKCRWLILEEWRHKEFLKLYC